MLNLNNAKDIVEAGSKVFIKDLVRLLPLGNTAVEIYDELQSKQVSRKILRLEEFYKSLADSRNAVSDRVNNEFVSKDDFLDVFEKNRYIIIF